MYVNHQHVGSKVECVHMSMTNMLVAKICDSLSINVSFLPINDVNMDICNDQHVGSKDM